MNPVYVYRTSPTTLQSDVDRALEDAELKTLDPRRQIWIKINLTSEHNYPGSNTSEWFLDAFIQTLKQRRFDDLCIIESEAHLRSLTKALVNSGIQKVLSRHRIPFLNIENLPRDDNGLPTELAKVQLINLPVLHTHAFAIISCATKNLYGLLPFSRFKYHDILSEKLIELAQHVETLTIVDGTVGLGGGSPRTGLPQRVDLILAGLDPLEIDVVAARIMGFRDYEIPLLKMAREIGVVTENIEVKGDFCTDSIPVFDFRFRVTSSLPQRMYRALPKEFRFLEKPSSTFHVLSKVKQMYIALAYHARKRRILKGPWTEYMCSRG